MCKGSELIKKTESISKRTENEEHFLNNIGIQVMIIL